MGARLLRVLVHAVAGTIATLQTPGAFLNGLRLMALDGTTLEVADTSANERAFGRPRTQRGTSAYPQVRLVALIETGTHAVCDVVLRPCRAAETPAGRRLLHAVGPGMLLVWDRNSHSFEMLRATQARGAHFLGRAKVNLIFEPTEVLADGSFLAGLGAGAPSQRRAAAPPSAPPGAPHNHATDPWHSQEGFGRTHPWVNGLPGGESQREQQHAVEAGVV